MSTRILRATVLLTYEDFGDEDIAEAQTPYQAEQDIAATLGRRWSALGMTYPPDSVEVVDAEYITPEEAKGSCCDFAPHNPRNRCRVAP